MESPIEPDRYLGELSDASGPDLESPSPVNTPSREPTRGRSGTRLLRPTILGSSKGLGNRQATVQDLDSDEEDPTEEFSTYPHLLATIGTKRGPPVFATPERLLYSDLFPSLPHRPLVQLRDTSEQLSTR